MSRFVKFFAAVAFAAGLFALVPGEALAQRHHGGGGYHGGGHYGGHYRGGGYGYRGWRGGGWGWGPGIGFGLGYGWGYPYYGGPYYARPYYYAEPNCGYVRARVWRNGHWVLRRAWRCW